MSIQYFISFIQFVHTFYVYTGDEFQSYSVGVSDKNPLNISTTGFISNADYAQGLSRIEKYRSQILGDLSLHWNTVASCEAKLRPVFKFRRANTLFVLCAGCAVEWGGAKHRRGGRGQPGDRHPGQEG